MVNGVQYVMIVLEQLMLEWLVNNWDTAIINHMITYLCKLNNRESVSIGQLLYITIIISSDLCFLETLLHVSR